MRALSSFFMILFLSLSFIFSTAQSNDAKARQLVLNKAIVDSNFIFGKWTSAGGTETHLKYLGQVKTKGGHIFKIVNSIWIWGLSQRATSRILIFNEKNQFIGNYYLTTADHLPTTLQNGKLILKNINNDCDRNVTTIINLNLGLPKQFFRECRDKYGDVYMFE